MNRFENAGRPLPTTPDAMRAALDRRRQFAGPEKGLASLSRYNELIVGAAGAFVARGMLGTGYPPGNLQTPEFSYAIFCHQPKPLTREARLNSVDIRAACGQALLRVGARQLYYLPPDALDTPKDIPSATMHGLFTHMLEVTGPGTPVDIQLAPRASFDRLTVHFLSPYGQGGEEHVIAETAYQSMMLGPEGIADMTIVMARIANTALSVEESRRVLEARRAETA